MAIDALPDQRPEDRTQRDVRPPNVRALPRETVEMAQSALTPKAVPHSAALRDHQTHRPRIR